MKASIIEDEERSRRQEGTEMFLRQTLFSFLSRITIERLAESHLQAARKFGEMAIGQAANGTLKLSYKRDTRTYTLKQFDGSGSVLAQGPKRVVKPALVDVYEVIEEG